MQEKFLYSPNMNGKLWKKDFLIGNFRHDLPKWKNYNEHCK